MLEQFRDGGWGMWPTLLFGLVLLAASLRYAYRPEGRLVPLLASLGLLTLFSGCLGFVTGIITTMKFVAQVKPEERYVALVGLGESLNNVSLALILCVLATLAVVIGAWRLARAAPGAQLSGARG